MAGPSRAPIRIGAGRHRAIHLGQPGGEGLGGQHVSRLVNLDAGRKGSPLHHAGPEGRPQLTDPFDIPIPQQQVGCALVDRPQRLRDIVDEHRHRKLDAGQCGQRAISGISERVERAKQAPDLASAEEGPRGIPRR